LLGETTLETGEGVMWALGEDMAAVVVILLGNLVTILL
jgi:hypothetical protein